MLHIDWHYHGANLYMFWTFRWISLKEIDLNTIQWAWEDVVQTTCLLKEHIPTSILNIQVHLLINLINEVQIVGTIHARCLFFLKGFIKTLKGFVRQKSRLQVSMANGCLVQDSCVNIS